MEDANLADVAALVIELLLHFFRTPAFTTLRPLAPAGDFFRLLFLLLDLLLEPFTGGLPVLLPCTAGEAPAGALVVLILINLLLGLVAGTAWPAGEAVAPPVAPDADVSTEPDDALCFRLLLPTAGVPLAPAAAAFGKLISWTRSLSMSSMPSSAAKVSQGTGTSSTGALAGATGREAASSNTAAEIAAPCIAVCTGLQDG